MSGDGSWALVTGASSGIGAATAEALLVHGYRVVGADINPEPFAARYSDRSADAVPVALDVRSKPQVESAFARVPEPVRLVVNCAGVSRRALIEDLTEADWDFVLDVNLKGTFLVGQAAAKSMTDGGLIVNVASIAGHRSFAGRANYCASKAGVLALTEVMALEYAARGVRVIALSPGFVRTPLATPEPGFVNDAMILDRTPMGRLASPEEIAGAIVALAEPTFAYMTGSSVVIDGGWCANGGFWPLLALEKRGAKAPASGPGGA